MRGLQVALEAVALGGTPDRGSMVGGMGEEPAQSLPSTWHTHRLSPFVLAELASFIRILETPCPPEQLAVRAVLFPRFWV